MTEATESAETSREGRGSGWSQFARALQQASTWVEELEICSDPIIRAQGLRYVGRCAIAALHHEVEYADPRFPKWFRCIDQVSNWGGPNVDNEYLSAAIDPTLTYRVHADLSHSAGIVLQTIKGIWHQPDGFSVLDDWSNNDLKTNDDGTLDIVLGGSRPHDGNWLPIHPEADRLWLRQYGVKWDEDSTSGFSISCIDSDGPLTPAQPEPAKIDDQIAHAAEWALSAVKHWPEALLKRSEALPTNHLPTPRTSPQGSSNIRYGLTLLDLTPSQGLYLEFEPPTARYWSIQLYDFPWWESLDARESFTTLNCDQIEVDDDGRVRLVIAENDPGVKNWIDSSTAPKALVIYRCVWAENVPDISNRVVELSDIDGCLPPGYPRISHEERRSLLTSRRRSADRWMNNTAL